jgi:hypothetical protein
MADVMEGSGLGLPALAVCRDGRVALDHGVEHVEEEGGAWLLVGVKDFLDGHLEIVGGRLVGLIHGEIKDGVGNRAEDPATNVALRGVPLRIIY